MAISDRRMKKAIEPMYPVLSKLVALEAKRYEYTLGNDTHQKSLGFLAQDLQPLFPEIVHVLNDGRSEGEILTVEYTAFGVIAIKAIQEQQAMMSTLKTENQALKSQIEDLQKKQEKFDQRLKLLEEKL